MTDVKSPCLTCQRVRDPNNCENKLCRDWQSWCIDRWDAMRREIRLQMENAELHEDGVQVGATLYSHPDRVREYFASSPCDGCLCPKDLCDTPCAARKVWDDVTEEGQTKRNVIEK